MKKDETMVWRDKTGKYKVGYSQHLQEKQLQETKKQVRVDTWLLICLIILIIIIIIGGIYAYLLVERIDALDPLAKLVLQ